MTNIIKKEKLIAFLIIIAVGISIFSLFVSTHQEKELSLLEQYRNLA